MKLSPRAVFQPLVGIAVLALVVQVTLAALETSGTWSRRRPVVRVVRINPYAPLDHQLAARDTAALPQVRDPFQYGDVVVAVSATPRVRRAPPPRPQPVLTAIVWDADPRATIRFNGREYSVRTSGLFDEFRVISIARDQVILDRGGEHVVLRLPASDR